MGQAKNKIKQCPVTGGKISPRECGENRMSTYDCPEDCPQNPWSSANYDRHMEIYERMTEKAEARLSKIESEKSSFFPGLELCIEGHEMEFATHRINQFFIEKNEHGQTFIEHWRDAAFSGLNNDQQILFKALSDLTPVILEVQRVVDDQQMWVIDRLEDDPKPFLLVDRSLASGCVRFSTLFSLRYKTPHFYRIHGAAITILDIPEMDPEEIFSKILHHLKAPKKKEPQKAWIFEHLSLIQESLFAMVAARSEAMFRNTDAAFSKTIYQIKGSIERFEALLEKDPDIHRERLGDGEKEEGFIASWNWTKPNPAYTYGSTLLARILIHEENHLRLETSSKKQREAIRPRFEKMMGDQITFTGERTDDLPSQILNRHPSDYNKALVPTSLLKNLPTLEIFNSQLSQETLNQSKDDIESELRQHADRVFLDTPIPLLGDQTPREAATNAKTRPELLRLMKTRTMHLDERNLKTGSNDDINETIRELGLDEIDFPPPPNCNCTNELQEECADSECYDDDDENSMAITPQEIEKRLTNMGSLPELSKKFEIAYPAICHSIDELFFKEDAFPPRLRPLILQLITETFCLFFESNTIGDIELFDGSIIYTMNETFENFSQDAEPTPPTIHQPYINAHISHRINQSFNIAADDHKSTILLVYFLALITEFHEERMARISSGRTDHLSAIDIIQKPEMDRRICELDEMSPDTLRVAFEKHFSTIPETLKFLQQEDDKPEELLQLISKISFFFFNPDDSDIPPLNEFNLVERIKEIMETHATKEKEVAPLKQPFLTNHFLVEFLPFLEKRTEPEKMYFLVFLGAFIDTLHQLFCEQIEMRGTAENTPFPNFIEK